MAKGGLAREGENAMHQVLMTGKERLLWELNFK